MSNFVLIAQDEYGDIRGVYTSFSDAFHDLGILEKVDPDFTQSMKNRDKIDFDVPRPIRLIKRTIYKYKE